MMPYDLILSFSGGDSIIVAPSYIQDDLSKFGSRLSFLDTSRLDKNLIDMMEGT